MKGVAGGDHLPGEPAGSECLIAGECIGKVPRLVTTAALVISNGLGDSLNLTLVTVRT